MDMERRVEEHTFSIEMNSRSSLTNISLSDKSAEPVLIQGELGKLEEAYFQEDVTLEVRGTKGILRLDVGREELERLLAKGSKVNHPKSGK